MPLPGLPDVRADPHKFAALLDIRSGLGQTVGF